MSQQKKEDPNATRTGKNPTNTPGKVTNQPERITNEGPEDETNATRRNPQDTERQRGTTTGTTPGAQRTDADARAERDMNKQDRNAGTTPTESTKFGDERYDRGVHSTSRGTTMDRSQGATSEANDRTRRAEEEDEVTGAKKTPSTRK